MLQIGNRIDAMAVARDAHPRPPFGGFPALALLVGCGFLAAFFGAFWDEEWHTHRGRDEFLIAPHVLLYAGVSVAGSGVAGWALLAVRRAGLGALREPALVAAALGVAVTLASGPIDNLWHVAFGRDAVAWSPPHLLGMAGIFTLAAAFALEAARYRGGGRRWLAVLAAIAVVGAGVMPVFEFESRVPQFDEAWYLPVLAAGLALALGLVRLAFDMRWIGLASVAGYALLRLACGIALTAMGFALPLVPLLFLPALVVDLAAQRDWPRAATAPLFAAALFATHVPYHDWLTSDLFIDAADVAVGLPVATLAAYVAFTATGFGRPADRRAATVAVTAIAVAALAAAPEAARAHDPGQGPLVTHARIAAEMRDRRAAVSVHLPDAACRSLRPVAVVARRAGEAPRGVLRPAGSCRYRGTVRVGNRGLWFVYAEFRDRRGRPIEVWLSVQAPDDRVVEDDRFVYLPPSPGTTLVKVVASVAMYGAILGMLVFVAMLYRRQLYKLG